MRVSKKKSRLPNRQLLSRSTAALLVLSGGAIGAAGSVHAQESGISSAVAVPEGNVEKVVVTARRRQETLQDVPVSVTAFTADQLSKQAIPVEVEAVMAFKVGNDRASIANLSHGYSRP